MSNSIWGDNKLSLENCILLPITGIKTPCKPQSTEVKVKYDL